MKRAPQAIVAFIGQVYFLVYDSPESDATQRISILRRRRIAPRMLLRDPEARSPPACPATVTEAALVGCVNC